MFATDLVEVLFNGHAPPLGTHANQTARETVEMYYWIITKENLADTIQKTGG
jgi:hypothetical protein